MKRLGLIASVLALALVSGIPTACAEHNTVGSRGVYDPGGTTLENAGRNALVQSDTLGGTTTVSADGAVHQVYMEASGELRAIGGGVANKAIGLLLPDGSRVMVASQDDATARFGEIRDRVTGKILAKNVSFTTNVSVPTLAGVEGLKAWGPTYIESVREARAGNTAKYEVIRDTISAVSPGVLDLLEAAFGVP